MSAWASVGVEVGWWDELGDLLVGEADVPAVGVEDAVVVGAEQDAVVEVGGAAGGPVLVGVVHHGPSGWSVASWEHASVISHLECSTLME